METNPVLRSCIAAVSGPMDNIPSGDSFPGAVQSLIDSRFEEPEPLPCRAESKRARRIHLGPVDALQRKADRTWVRAGCDHQVKLHLTLVTVIGQVDSRPEIRSEEHT